MSLAVLTSETAVKPGAGRADRKADTADEPGKFKSLLNNDAKASGSGAKGEGAAVKGEAADGRSVWSRYNELMNRTATGLGEDIADPAKDDEAGTQEKTEATSEDEEGLREDAGTLPVLHNKVAEVAVHSAAVVPTEKAQAVQAERASETETRADLRGTAEAGGNDDLPQPANRSANAVSAAASATEARQQPAAPQRGESAQQNQGGQQISAAAGEIGRDSEKGGADAGDREGNRQGGARDQSPPQAAQSQSAGRVSGVTVLSQQTAPAPVQPMTPTASALTESLAQGLTSAQRAAAASEAASLQPQAAAKPGMVTTLNIQLQPIDLGTVMARISGTESQLSIEITVENAEARQRLTTDSDSIVTALRGMGIEVDRVTVQQSQANTGSQQNNTGREQQFTQSQEGQSEDRSGKSGRGFDQESGHGARTPGNETSDPAGSGLYI